VGVRWPSGPRYFRFFSPVHDPSPMERMVLLGADVDIPLIFLLSVILPHPCLNPMTLPWSSVWSLVTRVFV